MDSFLRSLITISKTTACLTWSPLYVHSDWQMIRSIGIRYSTHYTYRLLSMCMRQFVETSPRKIQRF